MLPGFQPTQGRSVDAGSLLHVRETQTLSFPFRLQCSHDMLKRGNHRIVLSFVSPGLRDDLLLLFPIDLLGQPAIRFVLLRTQSALDASRFLGHACVLNSSMRSPDFASRDWADRGLVDSFVDHGSVFDVSTVARDPYEIEPRHHAPLPGVDICYNDCSCGATAVTRMAPPEVSRNHGWNYDRPRVIQHARTTDIRMFDRPLHACPRFRRHVLCLTEIPFDKARASRHLLRAETNSNLEVNWPARRRSPARMTGRPLDIHPSRLPTTALGFV
jgi:hypothetical protein